MPESAIRPTPNGIQFRVRLTPKGGRDALDGWWTDSAGTRLLKARVSAPPEDGKANFALIALLARALDVGKSKVRIVSGATSRLKLVEIEGDGLSLAARFQRIPALAFKF